MIYAFSDSVEAVRHWAAGEGVSDEELVPLTSAQKVYSMDVRAISQIHFVGEYWKNEHFEWMWGQYLKAKRTMNDNLARAVVSSDQPVVDAPV